MRVISNAMLMVFSLLVAMALAECATDQKLNDPCATVRCGYGSVCLVAEGKPTCTCDTICASVYKPVCGTDGNTYGNECNLKATACKQKSDIQVDYQGRCHGPARPVRSRR